MTIYEQQGYENRMDYLSCLSDDLGIDYDTVIAIADLLGPEEDFDGLVTSLQDFSEGMC